MKIFKRENYLRKIRGFYSNTGLIKAVTGVGRIGKLECDFIVRRHDAYAYIQVAMFSSPFKFGKEVA